MVQFLSIFFFLGFLQFLLGFSKVPVLCVTLYMSGMTKANILIRKRKVKGAMWAHRLGWKCNVMVDTKKIVNEVLHSTALSQCGVQEWICIYPKVELRFLYKAANLMTS